MAGFSATLRKAALLAAGVLAVHELRYRLEHGEAAEAALATHGHGYLGFASVLVAALLGVCAWQYFRRLAAGARNSRRRTRPVPAWLGMSAAIATLHSLQELAEGAFAAGHPEALAAVIGNGGPAALAVALVVGGLALVAQRGVEAGLDEGPRAAPCVVPATGFVARARAGVARAPFSPALELALAPRAPPTVGG